MGGVNLVKIRFQTWINSIFQCRSTSSNGGKLFEIYEMIHQCIINIHLLQATKVTLLFHPGRWDPVTAHFS